MAPCEVSFRNPYKMLTKFLCARGMPDRTSIGGAAAAAAFQTGSHKRSGFPLAGLGRTQAVQAQGQPQHTDCTETKIGAKPKKVCV